VAALHPLTVEVSVYAADAPTHDALTGAPGSWQAALAALHRLHALGVRTVWKTPLMAVNARQVQAMAQMAQAAGAAFRPDPVLTARVAGSYAERCGPLGLRMSDAQLAQALADLARMGPAQAGVPSANGPVQCTLGHSALLVEPDGTVMPCVEVRASLGSVRERALAAIWHDPAVWAPYLALAEAGALPACRACALRTWCVRCHGAAANETGDLHAPSPMHCRVAEVRRRLAAGKAAPCAHSTAPCESPSKRKHMRCTAPTTFPMPKKHTSLQTTRPQVRGQSGNRLAPANPIVRRRSSTARASKQSPPTA
jgi:radical SAM protein with 4Fe4S-binding SPASM domain